MEKYNQKSFWNDFWKIIATLFMFIGIVIIVGVLLRWAMIGIITVFNSPTLFNLFGLGLFLTIIGLGIMFIVEEVIWKG